MALELLKHYFSYWVFSIIHLLLVIAALRTYFRGRSQIGRHVRELKAAADRKADPQVIDLASAASELGREHDAADDDLDLWAQLQRLHARAKHPPFAEVRDRYTQLIGAYAEDLSRFVNVLLLTGVAGTLYGLYCSATHASAAGSWAASLAGSFDAFGVTIAAVGLAGGVILLQRSMVRFGDRSEGAIALVWERSRDRDARNQDSAAAVVVELRRLTEQFKPIVERMKQHSDRILSDSEALGRVATSCASLQASVEKLPGSLSTLTDSAKLSHEKYLGGLEHIRGKNEELFAQIREHNKLAFERIVNDIANFSTRLHGLDKTVETVVAAFTARVTEMINQNVAALQAKLMLMVDVVPDVERNLQQLRPSAAAAATAVKGVETESVAAIERVRSTTQGLDSSFMAVVGQVSTSMKGLEASFAEVVGQARASMKGLDDAFRRLEPRVKGLVSGAEPLRAAPEPLEPKPPRKTLGPAFFVALLAAGGVATLVVWVVLGAR